MDKEEVNLFRISICVYFPFLKLKKKRNRDQFRIILATIRDQEIFQVETFKRIIGVMKKKRVNLFRISLHVYFPFLKLKKKKSRSPRQQSGIGEIFQVEAFKRIIGVMDKEEGSKFISKFVRSRISFRRKQCRARRANWSAISNLSLDEEKKSFGSRHHLWSIGSTYTLLARNFVQLRNVGGHVDSRSGGKTRLAHKF